MPQLLVGRQQHAAIPRRAARPQGRRLRDSSAGTTFNTDWGWTVNGQDQPGYSYLLRTDEGLFLTYRTHRRGIEAILPVPAIWDRTVYGRQQDYEDSPDGWPQRPTYG